MVTDAVLGRGPIDRDDTPPIDKFIATQDGRESYSIPGASPSEDLAIFSGVLVEALWGLRPEALWPPDNKFVTSQSLKAYLKAEAPRRAALYKKELKPEISTNFSPGDDVYFGDVAPVNPAPTFQWPDASKLLGMGAAAADENEKSEGIEFSAPTVADTTPTRYWGVPSLGSTFEEKRNRSGSAASRRKSEDAKSKAQRREQAALTKICKQGRPELFETGSGFAVSGARIARVLTEVGIASGDPGVENWVHRSPAFHNARKRDLAFD